MKDFVIRSWGFPLPHDQVLHFASKSRTGYVTEHHETSSVY